jgi:hypothetical protein
MKIFKFSLVAIVLLCAIVACKKPTVVALNVTVDDAAAILGGSLASNSYGYNSLSADANTYAQNTLNSNLACGTSKTDTFTRVSPAGSGATYLYKLSYTRKLNCNVSNQADNFSATLTFTGNYNTSNVALANSGTATMTIAGLTPTATVYAVNGEYKTSGTFKVKRDTTNTGTASVDIVLKNLVINKTTQMINSGTGTMILTGSTLKKGDFTYNGTITFNGNAMATMALNGSNYTINLATGAVAKK